jgi:hypothetical protein
MSKVKQDKKAKIYPFRIGNLYTVKRRGARVAVRGIYRGVKKGLADFRTLDGIETYSFKRDELIVLLDSGPTGKVKKPDAFTKGYACAAAVIAHVEGAAMGRNLLREGGFSYGDLVDADCEECDIKALFPEHQGSVSDSKVG